MGRELPLVVVDNPFGDSCGKAAVADQYTHYVLYQSLLFLFLITM